MRRTHLLPSPLLLFVLPLLLPACEVGNIGDGPGGGGGGGVDPQSCEGPLGGPRDPDTLTACCTEFVGNAHCLPNDTVPEFLHDFVNTCDGGGYCVPDKFIETGGVYTPNACTSVGGADGVCLSGCIPDVEGFWGILPQDNCDDDERCTPCINPIDGTDTGACDIAYQCGDPLPEPGGGGGGGGGDVCPHEGPPVIDPTTLPACATCEAAHCLPNELVPGDLGDRLADCDATSKCVPDPFIEAGGNFIPAACPSVGDVEGRCLSSCLPEVQAQAALLPQSTCAASELCVPCFDPLTGEDTGACRLSCDPGPAGGPETLPSCCGGQGTCVPPDAAGDDADQLGQDECTDDLLCAPNVFIEGMFVPQTCETGFISLIFGEDYEPGVCLPDCLPAVDNFLIGQDGCLDGFVCAPCLDPLTGEPSGACEL